MKNALNYYYNLNPTSIHQINNNYRCYVGTDEYLLTKYEDTSDNINKIYELSTYLLQNKVPCHQIILNINNEIITSINGEPYLLLRVYVNNRQVTSEDIFAFSNLYADKKMFTNLTKDNWYEMWAKKIDYFEYQISQFGKRFPIVRESINYYIGMAENSISLFSHFSFDNNLVVCHKRIKNNEGLIDLYNPLNFILDNRTRDLSEYIKDKFFFDRYDVNEAKNDILKFNLNYNLLPLLFIRLLFPSYYFDYYEDVVAGKKNENILIKIVEKNNSYLIFWRDLYYFFNANNKLPEIEWIIKT